MLYLAEQQCPAFFVSLRKTSSHTYIFNSQGMAKTYKRVANI